MKNKNPFLHISLQQQKTMLNFSGAKGILFEGDPADGT